MKFGGTSVGDAALISTVARIVQEAKAGEDQVVVVVSAMDGVTDSLIKAARAAAEGKDEVYWGIKAELLARHLDAVGELVGDDDRLEVGGMVEDHLHDLERLCRSIAVLGELTVRSLDMVVGIGEKLSSIILAATLRARGMKAQAVDATQIVVTDDNFGAANPLMRETRAKVRESLLPPLERGVVPVVTGYIGATAEGVPTTLGRGGSDYTAAIIGACLEADEVQIWTDVDGILTADPKIVPEARTLAELSYAEAAELAYFGADVLHPKTIKPIVEQGIPLRIKNTFNPSHPGTLIIEKPGLSRHSTPAIISTKGLGLIIVAGGDETWTPEVAARALSRLARAGVDVLMFSQSFSERNLSLVVRQSDMEHSLKALQREFEGDFNRSILHLDAQERVATISVVGVPGEDGASIVPQTFAALGKHGTKVLSIAQASSEYNVSFVVIEDEVNETVRFLHHELGL